MAAEPVGEPPRRVRVAAHHGREPALGCEQPGRRVVQIATGAAAQSGPDGTPVSVPAGSVTRRSASTRAARFAEGRENEYAIAISSKCCSGYSISVTALYTVTSSPTAIRPSRASRAPYQTTVMSSRPGSSTWTAEISDHMRALRTAARRTSWEASR